MATCDRICATRALPAPRASSLTCVSSETVSSRMLCPWVLGSKGRVENGELRIWGIERWSSESRRSARACRTRARPEHGVGAGVQEARRELENTGSHCRAWSPRVRIVRGSGHLQRHRRCVWRCERRMRRAAEREVARLRRCGARLLRRDLSPLPGWRRAGRQLRQCRSLHRLCE